MWLNKIDSPILTPALCVPITSRCRVFSQSAKDTPPPLDHEPALWLWPTTFVSSRTKSPPLPLACLLQDEFKSDLGKAQCFLLYLATVRSSSFNSGRLKALTAGSGPGSTMNGNVAVFVHEDPRNLHQHQASWKILQGSWEMRSTVPGDAHPHKHQSWVGGYMVPNTLITLHHSASVQGLTKSWVCTL